MSSLSTSMAFVPKIKLSKYGRDQMKLTYRKAERDRR